MGVLAALGLWAAVSIGALPTSATLTNRSPATVPTVRRSTGLAEQRLATSSRLWFFGGFTGTGPRQELYYYDTAASDWVLAPQTGTPSGRDRHGLAWEPNVNRLVMFGGVRLQGFLFVVNSELYAFDPITGAWTLLTSNMPMPTARADVAMFWVSSQNRFLVFGGIGGTSATAPRYNELWWLAIDPTLATGTWTLISPVGTPPSARNASCAGFDPVRQRLVLFGGEGANAATVGGNFQYDVATNTWSTDTVTGTAPSNRSFSACAWSSVNDVLALYGGYDGTAMIGDTYAYDATTKAWANYTPAPTPGNLSDAAAAFSTDLGGLLLFGGQSASGTYTNGTWLLSYVGGSTNFPPTAAAGADQSVSASATVTVSGSASTDPESAALSYAWSQLSGPTVTLTGASTVSASFVAPSSMTASTVTLRLTVRDPALQPSTDDVAILVAANIAPIADAGSDVTVNEQAPVTLSGSGINPEPQPLSFQWSQTAGPSVLLSSTTSATPTFTSPMVAAQTTLTFSLVVSDGTDFSAADLVSVTVIDDLLPDGGSADAGGVDAGAGDAGSPDAGAGDAGDVDAGAGDAGEVDAGDVDAGDVDAGAADGGLDDDGGTFADGGAVDASVEGDGGLSERSTLSVGCGCSGTATELFTFALVALAWTVLRRRTKALGSVAAR